MVESTAVIASILLAFGIDATWDAWRERATELEIMDALYHEMLSNRTDLADVIRFNAEAAEHFNTFLRLSPAEIASTTGDRLALDALWAHYTFDPEIGALALFLQRDVSGSERGRLVRRSAVNWQAMLADAGEEGRVLWTATGKALELLAAYSVDQVPEVGREPNLYTILDDYGPRMARLRTDDEFLTAARAKFTLQQVYRDELSVLLDRTEKLLELLAPSGR
jgi:hypothetical protein